MDDAFIDATVACAGFSGRGECPLANLERRLAPLLASCDAALANAERAAGSFCADCYWPVFGLIMNEGKLSDTYWCAARNVVLAAQAAAAPGVLGAPNASPGAAASAPEAAALAALYDPRVAPRFTACMANVEGVAERRAAALATARNPYASPVARSAAPRCWRRDALLRGSSGQSLVRPELKARLAALTCPGADNKAAKPILDAIGGASSSGR